MLIVWRILHFEEPHDESEPVTDQTCCPFAQITAINIRIACRTLLKLARLQ